MSQHNIVPRLAISAALGGLLYGYDTAVINGATTVIKEHFHTGDAVLGLAVGSALITGCVGALLSGRIADKIGRRSFLGTLAVAIGVFALIGGLYGDLWPVCKDAARKSGFDCPKYFLFYLRRRPPIHRFVLASHAHKACFLRPASQPDGSYAANVHFDSLPQFL